MTITFPNQYGTRLTNGNYPCTLKALSSQSESISTIPTLVCTYSSPTMTINNAFSTWNVVYYLQFAIDNIKNPFQEKETDVFKFGFLLSTGTSYLFQSSSGISTKVSIIPCSFSTIPTTTNTNSALVVRCTPTEIPVGSTLEINLNNEWTDSQVITRSTIPSSTISCASSINTNSNLQCSYSFFSPLSTIALSNVVSRNINNQVIQFSISFFLSPPTTMPQGYFKITAYFETFKIHESLPTTLTNITPKTFSGCQFLSTILTVNALTSGTLICTTGIDLTTTDIISVTFPGTIGITGVTSVQYSNPTTTITSPTIVGQAMNLTNYGLTNQGNTFRLVFTSIKNPPSETTTSSFVIRTSRNNYLMEEITSSVTFAATRADISSAGLTALSY